MKLMSVRILGIESSCDETAAAVVADGREILSSVVASQIDVHRKYGGVVPELASREHLRQIVPVVREAMEQAGMKLAEVDAIAVTHGPGLTGALLVGITYGKTLAAALEKPLVPVNHLEGHVHAVFLEAHKSGREPQLPAVCLVVSGGHTVLYEVKPDGTGGTFAYRRIGQTRDDAAGEAYDKVAKLLGFGYPGGPIIDQLAPHGDPRAVKFTSPKMKGNALDFSFSGLKTAVLYKAYGQNVSRAEPPPPGPRRADLAASFQQAVVDVLVAKARQALRRTGLKRLAVGGGVAANKSLRAALEAMTREEGAELFIPPLALCTDNAAMAALAVEKWRRGELAPLDLDAVPTLVR
jgi:tRNA N6-adenosine threonylcarbamoyltransferase